MVRQTKLEDYPPGVQDLLKWAYHHLEQLDLLEREFRAWQIDQGETEITTVYIIDSQNREIKLFAPPGHPEPWAPATTAGEGEITTTTRDHSLID